MNFTDLIQNQKKFFLSGKTQDYSFRIDALKKLKKAVSDNQQEIFDAMLADFNKCKAEVYMSEIGLTLDEIGHHIKHLRKWMRTKRVPTPISQFPSKSFIVKQPKGVALIMSPWNYPLLLCLEPLVGAISAGCTAVVKPSAYTPKTSSAIAKIIGSIFPKEYIAVVEGGREQNASLLEEPFDYIFFTGSSTVGKVVLEKAAKNLTPVTLELGGKSPVIVDKSANISLAARRIAFGKVLNAGQTCVAPDYLFIHQDVKEQFVKAYKKALQEFFPTNDMSSMTVIVNQKHFERVSNLIKGETILIGGQTDSARRFIAPTLLDNVSFDAPIMQEEIFGPVLPMISYTDIQSCIDYINANPKPLALYLFTKNKKLEKLFFKSCIYGGGCINDTIVHIATSHLPFGGVGNSGMGSYHGEQSFQTFSHYKSILKNSSVIDLPIRYRPFTKIKEKLVRLVLG